MYDGFTQGINGTYRKRKGHEFGTIGLFTRMREEFLRVATLKNSIRTFISLDANTFFL